jgi:hypothetical protein
MNTASLRRHLALAAGALLVACGGTAARTASTPAPRSSPSATAALPTAGAGTPAVAANRLWLLQNHSQTQDIRVVDPSTGRPGTAIADGLPAPDWSHLYTVSVEGGNAIVVLDPQTGGRLDRVPVNPYLDLPGGGSLAGPHAGLSPNGRWLVLAGGTRGSDGRLTTSMFSVHDTAALHTAPRSFSLPGEWYLDGVDNAAKSVYMLHYLGTQATSTYEVHHYDLVADRLDSNPVSRKSFSGATEGPMSGVPVDRVDSADGQWQFTLYAFGPDGPFIHALNLDAGFALCIDLPGSTSNGAGENELLWALVRSHDSTRVWAVNAGTGHIAELHTAGIGPPLLGTLAVPSPSASPAAWWSFGSSSVAEAKRLVIGGAQLSPDDKTIYAVGVHGIAVVDTAKLSLRTMMLTDHDVQSLGVSADGRWLYAVLQSTSGGLLQVDTGSGAAVELKPYSDSIAVLRVTPAS